MSLQLQLKSSQGITLNGQNVSYWADQSGNGYHLDQTVASNQPEYVSSAYNGHPVLRFTGNEYLEALNTSALNMGLSDITLVGVIVPATGVNMRVFGKSEPSSGGSPKQYQTSIFSDRFYHKFADGSGRKGWGSNLNPHDGINHNIHISVLNRTGNSSTHEIDHVNQDVQSDNVGSITSPIDPSEKFRVGQIGTEVSVRFVGDILEIRIYDSIEDFNSLYQELNDYYANPFPLLSSACPRRSFILKGKRS